MDTAMTAVSIRAILLLKQPLHFGRSKGRPSATVIGSSGDTFNAMVRITYRGPTLVESMRPMLHGYA